MKIKYLFLILCSFFIHNSVPQEHNAEVVFDDNNFDSDTIRERLKKLDSKTPIELFFTPDVEKTIKKYLKTRLKFYKKNIDKINYYLPLFEEHLQNKNIPLEIKYLPLIESRLDPTAVSRV